MSAAYGINASGDVVGTAGNDTGFGCLDCVAFLWHQGTMTALGLLPGTSTSVARAVNGAGTVVGESISTSTGEPLAFQVVQGRMSAIPLLSGTATSTAPSVNTAGQVVGTASVMRGGVIRKTSGYLYAKGKLTNLSTLPAVVAAGMTNLSPRHVDDAGRIVGTALVGSVPHAFMLVKTAGAAPTSP
jgi:probable HAF family extracellular repeat protein